MKKKKHNSHIVKKVFNLSRIQCMIQMRSGETGEEI